ncbi:MAG: hypothetical protein M3388_02420 [Acidobacteriota bacterium]|nr:hypothetical protein [Acidobacteriota bacterium]
MLKIIFVMTIVICIPAPEVFARRDSRENRSSTASAANLPNPCQTARYVYINGRRVRRIVRKPCPEVTYINGRRVRTAHYYMCRGSLPRSAANRRCVCSNRRRRG